MQKHKHRSQLQRLVSAGGEGLNLAQRVLCAIAFGEKKVYSSPEAKRIMYGFRRYKFIRRTHKKDDYELTPKGEKKLEYILIDEVVIKQPRAWDGKWRLVIYDLPLRFKKAREAFRWKLKDLGFYQFQKSAWIYPYPCERELLFVADFYGVRKHLEILEISKIIDDRKLKTQFGLR